MSRRIKVGSTVVLALLTAGLAAWAWFLSRQDLDGADKWSSVASFWASLLMGAASIVFAILAWRDGRRARSQAGGQPRAGSTFHVTAGRDAYTAQEMTFNGPREGRDDGSPT